MNFRSFEKNIKKQREQQRVIDSLNSQIRALEKRRDEYAEKAKNELKKGNMPQYNAMVALLKYSIFNLSQAQNMLANFTIAKEMSEMQNLNKSFTKALDSVIKDVIKVSEKVNAGKTQQLFDKAVFLSNRTSVELRDVLKSNNATFVDGMNDISDVTDADIEAVLGEKAKEDDGKVDDILAGLEKEFSSVEKA